MEAVAAAGTVTTATNGVQARPLKRSRHSYSSAATAECEWWAQRCAALSALHGSVSPLHATPTSRVRTVQVEWSCYLGGCIDASPLVVHIPGVGLVVLIGSHSHWFCAMDALTGRKLWSHKVTTLCLHHTHATCPRQFVVTKPCCCCSTRLSVQGPCGG